MLWQGLHLPHFSDVGPTDLVSWWWRPLTVLCPSRLLGRAIAHQALLLSPQEQSLHPTNQKGSPTWSEVRNPGKSSGKSQERFVQVSMCGRKRATGFSASLFPSSSSSPCHSLSLLHPTALTLSAPSGSPPCLPGFSLSLCHLLSTSCAQGRQQWAKLTYGAAF